ncbi:hypothetical protein [Mycobacteroides abscessus]|uniref:hypothetical protein n=1 Tax=Mycobacteroides abscessus TaxID=36809 RepID=UPI000925F9EE|nr:hypothetical protein [Mycobacteroides abscessus]SIA28120.1 Uncharacterised protein [Mycobacteroides abscessus subsp. abscessus]
MTQWIAYDEDRGIMTRQDDSESVLAWLKEFTCGQVWGRRHYDREVYEYFIGPAEDDRDIYLVFPPGEDLPSYGFDLGDADLVDGRWAKDKRWYAWYVTDDLELPESMADMGKCKPCVCLIRPSREQILQYCIGDRPHQIRQLTPGDDSAVELKVKHTHPSDHSVTEYTYLVFRGDNVPPGVDLSSRELLSGFL